MPKFEVVIGSYTSPSYAKEEFGPSGEETGDEADDGGLVDFSDSAKPRREALFAEDEEDEEDEGDEGDEGEEDFSGVVVSIAQPTGTREKPKPAPIGREEHRLKVRKSDRDKVGEGLRTGEPTDLLTAYEAAMDKWQRMLESNPERRLQYVTLVEYKTERNELVLPPRALRDAGEWQKFLRRTIEETGLTARQITRKLYKFPGDDRAKVIVSREKTKTVRIPIDALDSLEAFAEWAAQFGYEPEE